MAAEHSDSPLRRLLARAYTQGDLTAVDELIAPGGITHGGAWGIRQTRTGLKRLIAVVRTAFPDLHCTIDDEIQVGDRLAAHWTLYGTHTGPFLGNQPTRRPVVVQGVSFARVANGQIVEAWTVLDQMSMLQQLGIVPPQGY